MRETLIFKILLYTHIASGGLALISGITPMLLEKGGKIHKRAGTVFVYAMFTASFSAFVLSIMTNNSFLLAVAVFSFYMNYTGYRALRNRAFKYVWYDWLASVVSASLGIYMISTRNTVLLVFGGILALMVIQDLYKQFKGDEAIREARRQRVILHIGRMVGTYIAAFTAFVVVNVKNVKPWWLPWLLPTLIGVPFIFYWAGQWRKKLQPK